MIGSQLVRLPLEFEGYRIGSYKTLYEYGPRT
jgi:hypothetical protein